MTDRLVGKLRELAGGLERRQAEYVEHLQVAPADSEALSAAEAMRESATALLRLQERVTALEIGIAAEREACAKIAELAAADDEIFNGVNSPLWDVVKDIRARSLPGKAG